MKPKPCKPGAVARKVESGLLLFLALATPVLESGAQSGGAQIPATANPARAAAMRAGEWTGMPSSLSSSLSMSANGAPSKLGVSFPSARRSVDGERPEAGSAAFPARPRAGSNPASATDSAPGGRRDPFRLPLPPAAAGIAGAQPQRPMVPGKHGLVISQLRLEGTVRGAKETAGAGSDESHTGSGGRTEMIAVVANASKIAYFLREHDVLYDGRVTRITADAVWFEQEYLDPQGRMKSRDVVTRLGAVADEEP